VEGVDDNWNEFARIRSLVSCWKARADATLGPRAFFAQTYEIAMPEMIADVIEKAARQQGGEEDLDRARIRNEVLACLPNLRNKLRTLRDSDVNVIMQKDDEVDRLLRGQLTIRSNITGFGEAVTRLCNAVDSCADERKRQA